MLQFEPLEHRHLLAAISWDGGGNATSWSDRFNWSTDQVPGASDDITIDVAGDATVVVTGKPSVVRTLKNLETILVSGRNC